MYKTTRKKVNKKKKKVFSKKVKFGIVIAIALIALIIISVITNPKLQAKRRLKKINEPNQMQEEIQVPEYLNTVVAAYNGELTPQIMAKTYNNLATVVIPNYYKKCKKLNNDGIKKFFNRNKELIEIELGYTEYEGFKNFVNTIKQLDGSKLELEDYYILENTIEQKQGKINAYLVLKYKQNKEIALNTQISRNLEKEKTSIQYTQIENQKLQQAKQQHEQQEQEIENYKSPYTRGRAIQ